MFLPPSMTSSARKWSRTRGPVPALAVVLGVKYGWTQRHGMLAIALLIFSSFETLLPAPPAGVR